MEEIIRRIEKREVKNFFELKSYLKYFFEKLDDYSQNEEIDFISRALSLDKEKLFLNCNLSKKQIKKVLKLSKKRVAGEPTDKIFHRANFFYDQFYINKNVLSPRKETELLVEKVLEYIKNQKKEKLKILDLCCGSGVIGLSIAKYSKNEVEICLSDISKRAIAVARKNQKKLEVVNNTKLLCSNMFSNLKKEGLFDIIVCNPPYIETNCLKKLSKGVKNFDPKIALDGGKDGLDFYRKIAIESKNFLNSGGKIFLEIGYNQKENVSKLFAKEGYSIKNFKDYSQNDRIIIASQM